MITDGKWICARCMDYKTNCILCNDMGGANLIPTPQSILDKEREEDERYQRTKYSRW